MIGPRFEGKPRQKRSPGGGGSWSCPSCCPVLEEALAFGRRGSSPGKGCGSHEAGSHMGCVPKELGSRALPVSASQSPAQP